MCSIEQHQCKHSLPVIALLLLVVQDAVILARKVHALLQSSQANGGRPHSLRSVATTDLIEVLRDYEKERKSRTRLITVRSNLMGQALQIPFAPVGHQCHRIAPSSFVLDVQHACCAQGKYSMFLQCEGCLIEL